MLSRHCFLQRRHYSSGRSFHISARYRLGCRPSFQYRRFIHGAVKYIRRALGCRSVFVPAHNCSLDQQRTFHRRTGGKNRPLWVHPSTRFTAYDQSAESRERTTALTGVLTFGVLGCDDAGWADSKGRGRILLRKAIAPIQVNEPRNHADFGRVIRRAEGGPAAQEVLATIVALTAVPRNALIRTHHYGSGGSI